MDEFVCINTGFAHLSVSLNDVLLYRTTFLQFSEF